MVSLLHAVTGLIGTTSLYLHHRLTLSLPFQGVLKPLSLPALACIETPLLTAIGLSRTLTLPPPFPWLFVESRKSKN